MYHHCILAVTTCSLLSTYYEWMSFSVEKLRTAIITAFSHRFQVSNAVGAKTDSLLMFCFYSSGNWEPKMNY
jgi:hypothetical protein